MSRYDNKKERGVILPIVGLTLAVLLGMAGLVIDLGAMFVAKTELQSAVDSCALAAAQELDGAADALTRGTSAGLTAGNANKVQYQKARHRSLTRMLRSVIRSPARSVRPLPPWPMHATPSAAI